MNKGLFFTLVVIAAACLIASFVMRNAWLAIIAFGIGMICKQFNSQIPYPKKYEEMKARQEARRAALKNKGQ